MSTKENINHNYQYKPPRDNKTIIGIIVILIGVGLILRNLIPAILPSWIFSFPMVLLIIGILIGARNNFKGWTGWTLIIIGALGLINNTMISLSFLRPIAFPIIIIVIGLSIIFRSRKKNIPPPTGPYQFSNEQGPPVTASSPDAGYLLPHVDASHESFEQTNYQDSQHQNINDDFVVLNSYLGGNNRMVMSKNFKGAKLTCMLGGIEIDLHNADFTGTVVIDVFCAFGGVEIRVPSNWYVKNEITPIMGGMEDDRRHITHVAADKVVILRGHVIMGGVELKS